METVTAEVTTAKGTATSPSDYDSIKTTLTFQPGETSRTVTVSTNQDTLREGNERFFVNLSTPTNAIITDGQGSATIIDNDGAITGIAR